MPSGRSRSSISLSLPGLWVATTSSSPGTRHRLSRRSPDARLGKFDAVAGGVADIDRAAALRPFEIGLDGEVDDAEFVGPHIEFGGIGGESRHGRGRLRHAAGLAGAGLLAPTPVTAGLKISSMPVAATEEHMATGFALRRVRARGHRHRSARPRRDPRHRGRVSRTGRRLVMKRRASAARPARQCPCGPAAGARKSALPRTARLRRCPGPRQCRRFR